MPTLLLVAGRRASAKIQNAPAPGLGTRWWGPGAAAQAGVCEWLRASACKQGLNVPKDDFKLLLACSRQLSHSPVSCPMGTGTGRSVRSQALFPSGCLVPPINPRNSRLRLGDVAPGVGQPSEGCPTILQYTHQTRDVRFTRPVHTDSTVDDPTRVAIALHCQSSCDDDNHYTGLHGCRLESLLHGPCEMAHAIFTQSRQT